MIGVVDYGAGNLHSVKKALDFLGLANKIVTKCPEILEVDKIIFPGVGAFGKAIQAIDERNLRKPLLETIMSGKPFLGICLGMQLLFESSAESPGAHGLGILKGNVVRFPATLKVPHLGWNAVSQMIASPLWKEIPDESFCYFAHSYHVVPADPKCVIGSTDYGQVIPVALQSANLFGVQFHPEKSQKAGIQILANFAAWQPPSSHNPEEN